MMGDCGVTGEIGKGTTLVVPPMPPGGAALAAAGGPRVRFIV
jgi:hypothetical protein